MRLICSSIVPDILNLIVAAERREPKIGWSGERALQKKMEREVAEREAGVIEIGLRAERLFLPVGRETTRQ